MWRFIFKKVLSGVTVLITIIVLISSIIYLAPVDPARLTFGQRSDNQMVEAKQNELGLNQPLTVQLSNYLADISPFVITNTASRYASK